MRNFKIFCILLTAAVIFAACYSLDCPLDSNVELKVSFYDYKTDADITLKDTLTITAEGTDSVLINRLYNTSSFSLPLQIGSRNDEIVTDTLTLNFVNAENEVKTDVITLKHRSYVHFEGADCPALVFHQILEATSTKNNIDSLEIIRNLVNYDEATNIRLHLHPAAE